MKYKLETIEGTEKYVLEEFINKFPDLTPVKTNNLVEFESEKEIDDFNILLSPLRITDERETTRNLFRREWRKEFISAGINPALAYIMCRMAKIQKDDIVLDPFCGGGTIAVTASLYFNAKKVIAGDISGKAIDITKRNFERAKIDKKKYFVLRKGVRDLKLQKESVDKIITNLPFGIRAGTHNMNEITYTNFEKTIQSLLKKDGILVILTQEKELLRKIFGNFKLIEEIKIHQGGLKPGIFVYKKV